MWHGMGCSGVSRESSRETMELCIDLNWAYQKRSIDGSKVCARLINFVLAPPSPRKIEISLRLSWTTRTFHQASAISVRRSLLPLAYSHLAYFEALGVCTSYQTVDKSAL